MTRNFTSENIHISLNKNKIINQYLKTLFFADLQEEPRYG